MFLFAFVIVLPETFGAWTPWPQQKGLWLVGHKAHSQLWHAGVTPWLAGLALLHSCCPAVRSGAAEQLPFFWHASVLLKDPKCLSEPPAWLWL